ncbi:MAG: heat-inducible transcriptional repressor HrcA [Mycoplasmataceae bacterium]|nr:heat-inducible transcriptional repressor HrcA [Mycoplasmataceae bacterium]
MRITERQKQILQIIIEEYTYTTEPISSKEIIQKYLSDLSSATIRNEMAILEKKGLLEKTHTSSGRIPSINGYKYYESNILKPKLSINLKRRLEKIFSQRDVSIDSVINQSVSIINESLKLPSVITTEQSDELLKRFDLIQIDKSTALILLVTSSGNINKNTIHLNDDRQLDDISICVRIFNDRLVNTLIKDIPKKVEAIKEIIRSAVHEYEFCIRQIIEKIFDFNKMPSETKIHGTKWLTTQPEFQNIQHLNKILTLLEDTNVWQHISYTQQKTGKTLITFGKEFGANELAIASTSISANGGKHQLSVVGPTRMDYSQVKGLLDFIKTEIEKLSSK